MDGVIIDTKLFSRPSKEERSKHKDEVKSINEKTRTPINRTPWFND